MPIRPGELNWMTAGRGIVHSERTPQRLRTGGSRLFGIQSWVALSAKDEETSLDFVHYDAGQMPVLSDEGKTVRVIAGRQLAREHLQPHVLRRRGAFGGRQRSACRTTNERAIYTVWGDIEISGDVFAPGQKDGKGAL